MPELKLNITVHKLGEYRDECLLSECISVNPEDLYPNNYLVFKTRKNEYKITIEPTEE